MSVIKGKKIAIIAIFMVLMIGGICLAKQIPPIIKTIKIAIIAIVLPLITLISTLLFSILFNSMIKTY